MVAARTCPWALYNQAGQNIKITIAYDSEMEAFVKGFRTWFCLSVFFLCIQHASCDVDNTKASGNMDQKLIMKLIEKIGFLEKKITKLEKRDEQMQDSIRALIANDARMRLENSEIGKRITYIESKIGELGKSNSNLVELFDNLKHGTDGVCVKLNIPQCGASEDESVTNYE